MRSQAGGGREEGVGSCCAPDGSIWTDVFLGKRLHLAAGQEVAEGEAQRLVKLGACDKAVLLLVMRLREGGGKKRG